MAARGGRTVDCGKVFKFSSLGELETIISIGFIRIFQSYL